MTIKLQTSPTTVQMVLTPKPTMLATKGTTLSRVSMNPKMPFRPPITIMIPTTRRIQSSMLLVWCSLSYISSADLLPTVSTCSVFLFLALKGLKVSPVTVARMLTVVGITFVNVTRTSPIWGDEGETPK